MATAAGIPRGQLLWLAVFVAFLVSGYWACIAFNIATSMGRCLALEGSVWTDAECRAMMTYPPAVAVVSLLLMLVFCCWEAQAEAMVRKVEAAGGARDGLDLPGLRFAAELGSLLRPLSDALAVRAIIVIFTSCMVVILVGVGVFGAGKWLLLKDPAHKGAAALVDAGSIIAYVGCVTYWFHLCCLFFPYSILRLRRFVRDNRVRDPLPA